MPEWLALLLVFSPLIVLYIAGVVIHADNERFNDHNGDRRDK